MTKEMYKKCLNEDMVIFGKLPKDVQEAMKNCKFWQALENSGEWSDTFSPFWNFNAVYRIDPSTPYEQEFVEMRVYVRPSGLYVMNTDNKSSVRYVVSTAISHQSCLGIIYEKDGVETLRTSVDLAFGTPKRVRFAK